MKTRNLFVTSVICLCLLFGLANAQAAGMGTVVGKILTKSGETMSGGMVRFFDVAKGPSPITHEYWRGQDYFFPIAEDGSFSASMPEGAYHLMALKKIDARSNKPAVPPEEGDHIYPQWNGKQKPIKVRADETVDLGDVKAVPFQKEWAAQGKTGVAGVVLDAAGRPVEGALVIAFATPAMDRPLFASDRRTGKNGEYIVRVPKAGDYYVRVMGHRVPVVPVTVNSGEITQKIDISLSDSSIPAPQ